MHHLFDTLKKIGMKIKHFFKAGRLSFVRANSQHYHPLLDFFRANQLPENYFSFVLKNLLNAADSQKAIYSNTAVLASGRIIGFDHRILFSNHHYWGSGLAVDPGFRKLGLARHLIKMGEAIARQHNIKWIKTPTGITYE